MMISNIGAEVSNSLVRPQLVIPTSQRSNRFSRLSLQTAGSPACLSSSGQYYPLNYTSSVSFGSTPSEELFLIGVAFNKLEYRTLPSVNAITLAVNITLCEGIMHNQDQDANQELAGLGVRYGARIGGISFRFPASAL